MLDVYAKKKNLSSIDEQMLSHAVRHDPELKALLSSNTTLNQSSEYTKQKTLVIENTRIVPKFVGYQKLCGKLNEGKKSNSDNAIIYHQFGKQSA